MQRVLLIVFKIFCLFQFDFFKNGGVSAQSTLPDVVIGDPNQDLLAEDTVGEPISDNDIDHIRTRPEGVQNEPVDQLEDPLNNPDYFEGDIIVPNKDILYQIIEGDPEGQLSAVKNPLLLWPKGVIHYVISSSFSRDERGIIGLAMDEFKQKTCIKFQPRNGQKDYVHILKGRGCSSIIGRDGGVQVLSLGNGCVNFGTVIHELMHAAGFWHEQARYDRDDYVEVIWDNIVPGMEYNFDKKSNRVTTVLGLPYDYGSIMHYGPYSFTNNFGSPTLRAKKNGVTFGQRRGFSQLDIQSLNLLYSCSNEPKPKPPKPTTSRPTPSNCFDDNTFCADWASKGYCQTNAAYMLVSCKKSCNNCNGGGGSGNCKDIGKFCADWSSKGECQSNPAYMRDNCKYSCGLCGTTTTTTTSSNCKDQNVFCSDWSSKGECTRNRAYMAIGCRKSCDFC